MKLARHLLGYAPVKLVAALCSFGGIYFYTRLLSADEYGRYALMFSVMALIHTLSLTWVEASVYRFSGTAKAQGKMPDHFRNALTLIVRALGFTLVLVGILLAMTWNKPEYLLFVPLIALHLPFNAVVKTAFEAHRANQQVKRYMMAATSKLLIGFIVGVLLAWKIGLGALSPIAGLLTGSALLLLFEGRWLLKQAEGGVSNKATHQAWLAYGIPTAIALGLDMLLSSADRFLIVYYLDEAAVGGYAAGYGIADKTVLMLCAWVAMAGSPLLMAAYENGGKSPARDQSGSLIKTLLLVAMPAAMGLAFVATPLANVMIGENVRAQAIEVIPWIAVAGLLNGLLIHYYSESFQLAHRTRTRAYLMAVPVVMNIALNVLLIPMFDIMGAVYATVASYLTAVILLGIVGRQYVALQFPLMDIARIGLACACMWPAIQLVPEIGGWSELFAKVLAGALVYGVVVFALNAGGARNLVQKVLKKRA
ncbi:MAG: lipopolysaccharide biosynthesis protein [Acidimicrobiales bacterium]|nr:lipopolysaccharide biosynthesis protein [Hyphomonadaceae bacterium]RZV42181.1 MAG: lipopolysaccharide biosynthesis protein [Acidimicrobiales bacterium]